MTASSIKNRNHSQTSPLRRERSRKSNDADVDTDDDVANPVEELTKNSVHTTFGFTPRTFPRPVYPSLLVPIYSLLKAMLWQAGGICTILTILLYPLYNESISLARKVFPNISEQLLFTILLSFSHSVVWALCNIPFYIFDSRGLFQKYKLHRTNGQQPTPELIQSTLIQAAISQLITSPLLAYFIYPGFVYFGLTSLDRALPSYWALFSTYCIAFAFNDTMFYWTHRLLHTKSMYFLHKQHHQYAGSMGIAAEYAHPFEALFSNIIPSIGGVVFFGCHHPLCILVWLAMRLQQTYFAHSGYCFNATLLDTLGLAHAESAVFHDHHHTTNRGNFGGYFWDYMGGTMDSFVAGGTYEGYLRRKES